MLEYVTKLCKETDEAIGRIESSDFNIQGGKTNREKTQRAQNSLIPFVGADYSYF